MNVFDIESLLSEVSGEAPCGEDAEYDEAYLTLVDLVRPKGAGAVATEQEGTAEEPSWREVGEMSFAVLQRSRHLGVSMYFVLSLLKREGLRGLRDGLYLVRGLLERFWDNLYPQLDPDDNYDPLQRISIVQSLSPRSVSDQDPFKFKQRLLEVPLCISRRMGSFGLRDIQIARSEIPPADGQEGIRPDMSVIEAAFRDTSADELLATSQAAREAAEHTDAIARAFAEKATGGQTPDLSGLKEMLAGICRVVQPFLGDSRAGDEAEEMGRATSASETQQAAGAVAGEIRSRKDAILALERVCRYFDRNEPSSPVPLLLRRAQRLVSKNFLEIVQDMCPDGMNQVESISGPPPSEDGEP